MHRTTSDGGASSSSAGSPAKLWRIGMLDRIRSIGSRDDRFSSTRGEANDPVAFPDGLAVGVDRHEIRCRKLQALVHRMRAAPSGPGHVDAAYKEFVKYKDVCSTLCRGVLHTACTHSSSLVGDAGLDAVRDWKNCLETLAEAFHVSLADTYRSYEREATAAMVDQLFNNKRFRKDAVHRMRNASVTRVLSADPQFFPRYEIRFRNYEKLKQELADIRSLLQSGESGISPLRMVEELVISPQSDAILEFANLATEDEPALRFRVDSAMLADTSPIFARIFAGRAASLFLHEAEDISRQLPPPPTEHVCEDGSRLQLYRMPQLEMNRLRSMELLLHAAHGHADVVPRDVGLDQLLAIAECCMRYKSTSPLAGAVEQRWLPQWAHRVVSGPDVAQEQLSDVLVVVSYAFGARQLFTRTSRSAMLHLVDEADLQAKPWPQKIKDKVWAVRCAKVDQVHACCSAAVDEYLAASERSPRCPKGSRGCDAANLGWLMLALNEVDMLPLTRSVMPQRRPRRSLAQMVDVLRRMPSPALAVHRGGVCDPMPALRMAIADIYDSVKGLTLHDISCKSHGWALSGHLRDEPQRLDDFDEEDGVAAAANEIPNSVRLRILGELDDVHDLRAAARTSRGFWGTYKRHEAELRRRMLVRRADDNKTAQPAPDAMQRERTALELDSVTLRSDDDSSVSDDDDDDDDDEDEDEGDATSMSTHEGVVPPMPPRPPPAPEPYDEWPPMTDEEVRRILWPDVLSPEPEPRKQGINRNSYSHRRSSRNMNNSRINKLDEKGEDGGGEGEEETSSAPARRPGGGPREKFLMGDAAFAEEKMLVVTGEKQLRSDHERRVGLLVGGDGKRGAASA
ncbi:hypothetical protein CP532_5586 [Ophiocordyceps camponoti-leonardi (nom. inval.)]|nr:hypothetical protein CP532_5586 [Ophiocordyceps camponoti-leonardi (nom. inval.)]